MNHSIPILPLLVLFFAVIPLRAQSDSSSVRDSTSSSLLPLPILFYAPENGVGLGGALLYVTRARGDNRPSTWSGQAIYTTKQQVVLELAEDVYRSNALYRINGGLHFSVYPDKFFASGRNDAGYVEDYSSTTFRGFLDAVKKITHEMNWGITTFYEARFITKTEPAGLLAQGAVPGSKHALTAGAGLLWTWDSRDNMFSTYTGAYHLVNIKFFGPFIGSEFSYTRLSVDLREFFELASQHILGLQATSVLIDGTPAFHKLAELGGTNLMRGYYQGRYNDNNMLAVQAEYRFPLWRIFSGAVFGAAGEVAHTMNAFDLANVKLAYGAGLRFMFQKEERLVIRLDFGFAKGSSAMYIAADEAF